VKGVPIVIEDAPEFKWRGLMIDSSRHFLPLSLIKKTIDGLLFNKMNILHWHIIDQDSFPLEIPSVP
jgi:hexosaminidase